MATDLLANEDILLRQRLRESMDEEIRKRTLIHQAKISRLRSAKTQLLAAGAPQPGDPLVMLAHGDSWFDYPLTGNGLPVNHTDIVAQLTTMGNTSPLIHNISQFGDATTDEMSWPKQQRLIDSLQDSANWLDSGKPDAILFSGGGNDVVGDKFCIFVDYAIPGGTGLNALRFQKAIGMVEASYRDLFLFRDRYAPGVPIFGHCYDFPIPNGIHPICAGPWLKPSLDYCGWNLAQGTNIAHDALTAFRNLLLSLAVPANNFFLVDTQGVLAPGDWANELHPQPGGFAAIAQKFVDMFRQHFPGRI